MRSTVVVPLALVLALAACLVACTEGGPDRGPVEGRKIRVLATTGMVADVVRNVGGDRVEVDALMGPGVDPHLYKAGASDLTKLRAADVIAYNGHYLEGKMGKVLADCSRTQTVVAISEVIATDRLLVPAEGGHPDPHVWFDVALWAETTGPVAEALSKVDPKHADDFRARADAFRKTLLALDAEVREKIATIPAERRVLITSHDAFRYFGRAYDIEVMGLQGVSTATEVSLADRRRIVNVILQRKLKALFVESSVSPKAIDAVRQDCAGRGHEVKVGGTLYSDAMGESPPADTYVGMVRANVDRIVEALR